MQIATATEDQVLLVNERDEVQGTMGKLEAHRRGTLHRAFSIFLFDDDGLLLLQRRAAGKYHSAGLWTNTCCSHPRPDEALEDAARRRLLEEMGIDTPVVHRFSFIYKAELGNGLFEHELDHVFFGHWNGPVEPHPEEADDWKYMNVEDVEQDLHRHPERYTVWLRTCWDQVRAELNGAR